MERDCTTPLFSESSAHELEVFAALQKDFARMYSDVFPDRNNPRTVVVLPSLTMNQQELAKIEGATYYEERMLCLLMLLQLPRTHIIYLTSMPLPPSIVDYYLHLLPGIPGSHAKARLTLMSCHDNSPRPLTEKLLERPRMIRRLRKAIQDPTAAHLSCFNVTPLERTLAVRLGIPIYGCDPELLTLGSKSGSRRTFREAGVALPEGREDLYTREEVVSALIELKRSKPELLKAAIKLNEGFSGEGNAVFHYKGAPSTSDPIGLKDWIQLELPQRIRFEAHEETYERFFAKFREMGGVVEAWIDGRDKCSPSVQCRINPLGEIELISTHDQVLGGPSGQVFLGCTFPAADDYRREIQNIGLQISKVLRDKGVLGRFAVDFISIREQEGWKHYAIEINLRKGGTTLPFLMMQFLINGTFDIDTGHYISPTSQARYYYASDNLQSSAYKGLTPEDLIDILVCHRLHFHGPSQQGVTFHLMGALSEFGKLGLVCIGDSPEKARELYDKTVAALAQETL